MENIEMLQQLNEQKIKDCRQNERDLVVGNPEFIGINFDQDYIVDARNFWSQERCLQYIKEGDIQVPDEIRLAFESGQANNIVSDRKQKEIDKQLSFYQYLFSFEGKLQHVRVSPVGESSPVNPSQAIDIKPDGNFDVVIAPEYIEQIKIIRQQTNYLTLVVPFYDHRRGKEKSSDVPETQEQVEQYIAICDQIIENIGSDIQLEIGNETNVSRDTGAMFTDLLQHASHVNSIEYGKFFFQVVARLKEKSPALKLSIAGVACFDPTYLGEVLAEVKRLQIENKIVGKLVDTISFHPYRGEPENGAIEVKNGVFTVSGLNNEAQEQEMQKIALDYDVELTVGEIGFPFSDSEQKRKLEQAVSSTAKNEILSLIYPGVNVH